MHEYLGIAMKSDQSVIIYILLLLNSSLKRLSILIFSMVSQSSVAKAYDILILHNLTPIPCIIYISIIYICICRQWRLRCQSDIRWSSHSNIKVAFVMLLHSEVMAQKTRMSPEFSTFKLIVLKLQKLFSKWITAMLGHWVISMMFRCFVVLKNFISQRNWKVNIDFSFISVNCNFKNVDKNISFTC